MDSRCLSEEICSSDKRRRRALFGAAGVLFLHAGGEDAEARGRLAKLAENMQTRLAWVGSRPFQELQLVLLGFFSFNLCSPPVPLYVLTTDPDPDEFVRRVGAREFLRRVSPAGPAGGRRPFSAARAARLPGSVFHPRAAVVVADAAAAMAEDAPKVPFMAQKNHQWE